MDQLQISIEKKKKKGVSQVRLRGSGIRFLLQRAQKQGGALIIIIIFPLASSPHQMHSYLDRDICRSKNKAILVIYSLHPPHPSLSIKKKKLKKDNHKKIECHPTITKSNQISEIWIQTTNQQQQLLQHWRNSSHWSPLPFQTHSPSQPNPTKPPSGR